MNRQIKFLRTRLGRLIRDTRRKIDGDARVREAFAIPLGHNATNPWRVFKSGQKRDVHGQIKNELRQRSAIEPVIGHYKADGHLDRNFLKRRLGDKINATLLAINTFSTLKPAS